MYHNVTLVHVMLPCFAVDPSNVHKLEYSMTFREYLEISDKFVTENIIHCFNCKISIV